MYVYIYIVMLYVYIYIHIYGQQPTSQAAEAVAAGPARTGGPSHKAGSSAAGAATLSFECSARRGARTAAVVSHAEIVPTEIL